MVAGGGGSEDTGSSTATGEGVELQANATAMLEIACIRCRPRVGSRWGVPRKVLMLFVLQIHNYISDNTLYHGIWSFMRACAVHPRNIDMPDCESC